MPTPAPMSTTEANARRRRGSRGQGHEIARFISSLMIAVLLSTFLSPSFAWEAVAAQATHAEADSASDPRSGTDGHEDAESHVVHGCAGHVLGHLAALSKPPGAIQFGDDAQARIPERQRPLCQITPKRVEHPPELPRQS